MRDMNVFETKYGKPEIEMYREEKGFGYDDHGCDGDSDSVLTRNSRRLNDTFDRLLARWN
jgi:hypothetical protein